MHLNIKYMTQVFEMYELLGTKKMVLLCIAAHKNSDTGRCYPSVGSLAAMSGLSKPTVDRAIKELKGLGLLIVTNRFKGRVKDSNQYDFNFSGKALPIKLSQAENQARMRKVAEICETIFPDPVMRANTFKHLGKMTSDRYEAMIAELKFAKVDGVKLVESGEIVSFMKGFLK